MTSRFLGHPGMPLCVSTTLYCFSMSCFSSGLKKDFDCLEMPIVVPKGVLLILLIDVSEN